LRPPFPACLMDDMDLTKEFPRSPLAKLGPYNWLPRLIDKARAALADTLGEYNYNCPLDQKVFAFLAVTAEAFRNAVKDSNSDDAILDWVKNRASPRSDGEIAAFSRELSSAGPADEPGVTWFQRIDREEGRQQVQSTKFKAQS